MVENGQETGNGRAKNGCFAPGHPCYRSKDGTKTGRKKTPKTMIADAVDAIDTVRILKKLAELCLAGNHQACIYLCDRQLGKPRQVMGLEGSKPGDRVETSLFLCSDGTTRTAKEMMSGDSNSKTD
jgi:hypothetical protein